jgi:LuxR family maltose regulon positive regulatory protein
MREVERLGLFASVNEGPQFTLTLHDLFRDFLQVRLEEEHPGEMPRLMRKAAETEPDLVRRLDLLVKASAWQQAEDLLFERSSTLSLVDLAAAERLIEHFPADRREASPPIAHLRGLSRWWHGGRGAGALLTKAAAGFDARGELGRANRARAYLAEALVLAGRFEEGLALSGRVRARSPGGDRETGVILAYVDYFVSLFTGPDTAPGQHLDVMTDLFLGAPPETWLRASVALLPIFCGPGFATAFRRFMDQLRAAATVGHHPHARTYLAYYEAMEATHRADVARAESLVEQVEEDAGWGGTRQRPTQVLKFLLAALRGRCDVQALEGLVERELFGSSNPISARHASRVMLVTLGLGDIEHARRLLAVCDKVSTHDPVLRAAHPGIVEGWQALAAAHPAEACRKLRPEARRLAESDMYGHAAIFVGVALAAAELRCGDRVAAWAALRPVFQLLDGSGYIGFLLAAGQPLVEELAHADWQGVAQPERLSSLASWAAHGSRLLQHGDRVADGHTIDSAAASLPSTGLSAREIDVLERLAEGKSNKLIARELDLSPHTVKRHVARILSRLDVVSRGAAADWYRRAPGAVRSAGGGAT